MTEELPVLARGVLMTSVELANWVETAFAGERVIYARGCFVDKMDANPGFRKAWFLYREGRVHLVQRRINDSIDGYLYEYMAVKASKHRGSAIRQGAMQGAM